MHIEVITKNDLDLLKQEIINSVSNLLKDQTSTSQWLKSVHVREMLNISAGTLQSYRENGKIPYTRIGETIFYDRKEIEKVLNDNKVG